MVNRECAIDHFFLQFLSVGSNEPQAATACVDMRGGFALQPLVPDDMIFLTGNGLSCQRNREGVCGKVRNDEVEKVVTKMMLELGVPAHLKGYHYMRSAIILALQEKETKAAVTKSIYPEIAKRYETSGQKVERAIRNAIECRGNEEYISELFGYTASSEMGRPTNSEYIARIVDELRLQRVC